MFLLVDVLEFDETGDVRPNEVLIFEKSAAAVRCDKIVCIK